MQRNGVYRSAHGALVGVVSGAREAGAAEGVAARRRHRLKEQLHAEYALRVVAPVYRSCRPEATKTINLKP
jgi:hypothetical protein